MCLRHLLFDDLHLIFIFGAHSVIRCAHRYIRVILIRIYLCAYLGRYPCARRSHLGDSNSHRFYLCAYLGRYPCARRNHLGGFNSHRIYLFASDSPRKPRRAYARALGKTLARRLLQASARAMLGGGACLQSEATLQHER